MLYIFVLKFFFVEADRQQKFINAEISSTCTCQRHSRSSSDIEEYERACRTRGYHKYKVLTVVLTFVHYSHLHHLACRAIASLSTIAISITLFAGRLLALADMLATILWDPETTLWLEVSLMISQMGPAVNQVKSRAFKMTVLCAHHACFCTEIYNVENFCEFNFCCQLDQ